MPLLARLLFALALLAGPASAATPPTPAAELGTYGDIAEAMFQDSLTTARALKTSVDALLANPKPATLGAARNAWKAARVPYQQTEGLRFGNPIVDEWEARVNGWPLDEGLIDYVAPSYGTSSDENPLYTLNVIARTQLRIGPRQVNAAVIDKALLRQLQGASGVESNVATGYHAIEFLLWGQDLNGTGPGAGNRPASDFNLRACSNGNCVRRAAFLKAATELLIDDLAEMASSWAPNGAARRALAAKGALGGLSTMLTGLGSLSYGELAGERMKLGLILRDPEEEHDCFSDNTHNSQYYTQVGMSALWRGTYRRIDGSTLQGPALRDYARTRDSAASERLDGAMNTTLSRLNAIKTSAESGRMAYDQLLGSGNAAGNKLIQDSIDGLIAQTRAIEGVVVALGLKIAVEGSDSLDNPAAVQ